MSVQIHPTALVDPAAELADGVTIGPWCLIEADVRIGAGSVLGPGVIVRSGTRLGKNNTVYQYATLGEFSQDKKYKGEPASLVIGDGNVIRESCTVHRGTVNDGATGETVIGSNNLLMVNVHVAHDCVLGNDAVLANNCALAGHVHLGDGVILGGFTGVHQFCRLGRLSFSGVGAVVLQDVPPFVRVIGSPARANGLNTLGLRRAGLAEGARLGLKKAYRAAMRGAKYEQSALDALGDEYPAIEEFLAWMRAPSRRGVVKGVCRGGVDEMGR